MPPLCRLLVSVKRVVDYSVKVRVKSDRSSVETNNVKMSLNPFDEVSMELAVQLKEKNLVNEVVAVTVGPPPCQETLRHALAFGADRGVHIETEDTETEPLMVAKLLQKLVLKEQPDLVALGKQAIDDDCHQTGQILAGLLNWPQATCLSQLEIIDQSRQLRVTREIDSGLETLRIPLPAVVTTDLRLNAPRFLAIQNIMKARKKPIEKLKPEDLGLTVERRIKNLRFEEPPVRKAGIRVTSVEELVKHLKKDGVI
ncbi:electron transfer flavoprotein subunit beta-like [Schistocerca gregaria]|uniref:electron transfer flavoprotein subunit beta-like n=1 Tax=Schistocerca gregaria TaxID=7010 RepID=UPI00211F1382|nr:electron transfer flavoprotein subunit beta-like [Schistocerca gregaria]